MRATGPAGSEIAITGTGSRCGRVSGPIALARPARSPLARRRGAAGSTGIGCACERGLASASASCRRVVFRLNRPTPHTPCVCVESRAGDVRGRSMRRRAERSGSVRSGAMGSMCPGPSDGAPATTRADDRAADHDLPTDRPLPRPRRRAGRRHERDPARLSRSCSSIPSGRRWRRAPHDGAQQGVGDPARPGTAGRVRPRAALAVGECVRPERPTAAPPPPVGRAYGTVLDFGRYAGWSFGQLAVHDPDYLLWLERTPIGRPMGAEIRATLLQVREPELDASPLHASRRRPLTFRGAEQSVAYDGARRGAAESANARALEHHDTVTSSSRSRAHECKKPVWPPHSIEFGPSGRTTLGSRADRSSTGVPSSSAVLEIGPFCNPALVGTHVRYFDVLDSDGSGGTGKRLGKVQIVVRDDPLCVRPARSLRRRRERSPLFSSHCIEHQPDLVHHLQQVSALLQDDGRYFLSSPTSAIALTTSCPRVRSRVPRSPCSARVSTTSQSVIEHRALITHNDPVRHWRGDTVPCSGSKTPNRCTAALDEYSAANGRYIDVHAWQFTPAASD